MFCTQCGAKIPDQSKFCPECGAALASASAAVAPIPVVTSAQPAPAEPSLSASISNPPSTPSWPPCEWVEFFNGLAGEFLCVNRTEANRFEFSGERKIKALLSRTTLSYKAVTVLDPSTRNLEWWEKLTENTFGIRAADFGGSLEISCQKGAGLKFRRIIATPGAAYSYSYGELREVVEVQAKQLGWSFHLSVGRCP